MVAGLDAGFIKREYAGVPMWGWIVGGVGILVGFTKLKSGGLFGGSSTATPTAGTSAAGGGTGDPGNIFFMPQQGYPNPTQVTVNSNPRPFGADARIGANANEGPKLPNQSKIMVITGETWQDVTTRAYGWADAYADAKAADQPRIRDVALALQRINGGKANPTPGQYVYFN